MGKASSSKKVARAAGLGGSRAYGSRPPWGYYFAVFALVLLGVIGVYNSREYRDAKITNQGNSAPAVGTTWYEGFAVDACGKLLPPIKTDKDPYGITTKGDGVIYISPTVKSAAGANATLGKFASSIGMTFNAGEIEVPGGHPYVDNDTCEGKPGHVYVETWASPAEPVQDGVVQTKEGHTKGLEDTCDPDCDSGVRLENDQLVTIAFLPSPPKGHTVQALQPPQAVISKLTSLVSAAASGTTTTVPSAPSTAATTSTTVTKGKTTTSGASSTTGTAAKTGTTAKTGSSSTTGTTAKATTSTAGPTTTGKTTSSS
jgi:hypothetical protein